MYRFNLKSLNEISGNTAARALGKLHLATGHHVLNSINKVGKVAASLTAAPHAIIGNPHAVQIASDNLSSAVQSGKYAINLAKRFGALANRVKNKQKRDPEFDKQFKQSTIVMPDNN